MNRLDNCGSKRQLFPVAGEKADCMYSMINGHRKVIYIKRLLTLG